MAQLKVPFNIVPIQLTADRSGLDFQGQDHIVVQDHESVRWDFSVTYIEHLLPESSLDIVGAKFLPKGSKEPSPVGPGHFFKSVEILPSPPNGSAKQALILTFDAAKRPSPKRLEYTYWIEYETTEDGSGSTQAWDPSMSIEPDRESPWRKPIRWLLGLLGIVGLAKLLKKS